MILYIHSTTQKVEFFTVSVIKNFLKVIFQKENLIFFVIHLMNNMKNNDSGETFLKILNHIRGGNYINLLNSNLLSDKITFFAIMYFITGVIYRNIFLSYLNQKLKNQF